MVVNVNGEGTECQSVHGSSEIPQNNSGSHPNVPASGPAPRRGNMAHDGQHDTTRHDKTNAYGV